MSMHAGVTTEQADDLFSILAQGLAARMDQPFLLLPGGSSVTFGRLLADAARVGAWLERCGARTGGRAAVQLDKSPATVVHLGCVRSGVAFVPLNAAYAPHEVECFPSDSDPALVAASAAAPAASICPGTPRARRRRRCCGPSAATFSPKP